MGRTESRVRKNNEEEVHKATNRGAKMPKVIIYMLPKQEKLLILHFNESDVS